MELGTFSVSLSVKDLGKSKAFYETLGFTQFGGEVDHGYVIMQNGAHLIGLFHNMFEGNMLTFNPGWDQSAQALDSFEDVRDIEAKLKEAGVQMTTACVAGQAPTHCIFTDPDGNVIMLDQHVPRPKA
ncbi:putative lactoylglutathione lyase [Pacificibacter maritimus]|uniref:Putative lactoylglutathione lyase n=1 Tax=Pacificibacter maritimus TaxID=762213 RepID=A0A3N4UVZ6_9RHOB|nr:VOC family protein [Pacificibacter maritimus]RPE71701.1 putative lactoylglutathione lyase [Pacificibacter maritimus]